MESIFFNKKIHIDKLLHISLLTYQLQKNLCDK